MKYITSFVHASIMIIDVNKNITFVLGSPEPFTFCHSLATATGSINPGNTGFGVSNKLNS